MTTWKNSPWKVRRKMCTGKAKFGEKTARAVAKQHGQRAYFCPICSAWHCTSRR